MTKEEAKIAVRLKYCPCGSQRCYGQDEWIEGCTHYKELIGEKSLSDILKDFIGKR